MTTLLKFGTTLFTAAALNVSYVQASEVDLMNAFNIDMSRYGIESHNESFTAVVDNLSPTKSVFIHREKEDGTWVDMAMYYAGPAGSGKEYWKTNDTHPDNGDEFVVGMKIGDVTYWDNNDGLSYVIQAQGYLLGAIKPVVVDTIYANAETVMVQIVVNNLAPNKDIKLIYSTDNWQSSTEVSAQYNGSKVMYGYGSYANPNANNAESWSVTAPITSDTRAEFYVVYSVNGQTYYDNNYHANYIVNPDYASDTRSMHLRMGPTWSAGMPMTLVADNLWAANVQFSGMIDSFKFDAYNDWKTNFGDNNQDGIAEANGTNIPAPAISGKYRVTFNTVTGEYSAYPYGLND